MIYPEHPKNGQAEPSIIVAVILSVRVCVQMFGISTGPGKMRESFWETGSIKFILAGPTAGVNS